VLKAAWCKVAGLLLVVRYIIHTQRQCISISMRKSRSNLLHMMKAVIILSLMV
jgi:hypothetical protein